MPRLQNCLTNGGNVWCRECLDAATDFYVTKCNTEIPPHMDYNGDSDEPCCVCKCGPESDRLDSLIDRNATNPTKFETRQSVPYTLRFVTPDGSELTLEQARFVVHRNEPSIKTPSVMLTFPIATLSHPYRFQRNDDNEAALTPIDPEPTPPAAMEQLNAMAAERMGW